MKLSRRKFLQSSAAVLSSAAVPLCFTLPRAAFASDDASYKAIVVVFLNGGSDSFNMVLPMGGTHYDDYVTSRPNTHFPINSILDAKLSSENGVPLGINPNMPMLAQMMNDGDAVPLINIGALIEPTNKGNLNSVMKPQSLGSHSTQQGYWQKHFDLDKRDYSPTGWGGAMMDLLYDPNLQFPESMAVSNGQWYNARHAQTLKLSTESVAELTAFKENSEFREIVEKLNKEDDPSPFIKELQLRQQDMFETESDLQGIMERYPEDPSITGGSIGDQLRMVKRMMEAAIDLGHQRQVFYVSGGGWDTHGGTNNSQLADLDEALGTFQQALNQSSFAKQVTTVTLSEFGRGIRHNSRNGTDHGWGSIQLAMGGSVKGGRGYGSFPEFLYDGADATGNKLIPELSHEQMAATVAQWLGISDFGLDLLFPILHSNRDNAFPQRTLGFLEEEDSSAPPAHIKEESVSASSENPNGTGAAQNAVDGNPFTKWSAKGKGILYTLSFDSIYEFDELKLAMDKGDSRNYYFDIQLSADGEEFITVGSYISSGSSLELESYSLGGLKGRAVRLVCNGNNDSSDSTLRGWNNFSQIEAWGS